MKTSNLIHSFFLGFLLIILSNSCSVNYEDNIGNSITNVLSGKSQLLFVKSPVFNWNNKKVAVSYEDDFRNFSAFEKSGYTLTNNNLRQGITVQLKIIDFQRKSESINEIMIESYDLSEGVNQFTIGYNDNKPYIIY